MIKAYTIHRYWVEQTIGEIMAQISFALKGKDVAHEKFFPSKEFAKAYIDKEARQWFLQALEDYINHKKQIINASHPEQLEAVNKCWAAYVSFEGYSIEKIITQFNKGYVWFEKILPHPNNASHQSSFLTLQELKTFCSTYLNNWK